MPDVDTLNGDNDNNRKATRLLFALTVVLAISSVDGIKLNTSNTSNKPHVNNTKSLNYALINLTDAQSVLYNRIKSSKYINNPYRHLNLSQCKIGI